MVLLVYSFKMWIKDSEIVELIYFMLFIFLCIRNLSIRVQAPAKERYLEQGGQQMLMVVSDR